jgi:trk system potassium uptake protein TrkH
VRATLLIPLRDWLSRIRMTPARVLFLGFAGIILFGGFLLWLPISAAPGQSIAFIDALYTSTSAVCVTGLIVVDTPVAYSFFGQFVVLLLIQAGGLGYMTLAGIIFLLLRRRVSLRDRLVLQEALNVFSMEGIVRFVKRIVLITALVESIGALILTVRWMWEYPFARALWLGVFHSVSAFNNAGFSLFSTNLIQYVGDPTVVFVITSNIIIGGIGYLVISELYERRSTGKRAAALSLHARMALAVTAFLIIGGTASLFVFEIHNAQTLQPMGPFTRFLAAYFQAVTPRTAGFNTIDIGAMTEAAQLLLIALMFIGASPGGTGGGIKTTSFGVIMGTLYAQIRGKADVVILKRRLSPDTIAKAFNVATTAFLLVITVTITLSYFERESLLRLAFETTSAFGTVGLSMTKPGMVTSISALFSSFGKLLIILTMFAGRVGPITVGAALLAPGVSEPAFRYPEDRVMIG